ncbi:MAG: hypothetical protein LAO79_27725 [Acidobacteriia bacterium]|nr:hypothetical protein [Terriglobia bacterium]
MNKNWLGPLLDRNLRPVAAPEELWERVCDPRPRPKPVLRLRLALAMIAAVATAWALHPRTASFDSQGASEMRAWVMDRTGLDVPLSPAAPIRLCGSTAFGNGSAEIRYKLRDREARILVAKAERYTQSHEFVSRTSSILRGQSYTVSGLDAQTACILCHVDPPAMN